jgi:putative transcription factor
MVYHGILTKGLKMICEMCGSDVPRTKFVTVEGATMHVCSKCEKFASSDAVKTEKGQVMMPSVADRLVSRQRRQKERDVYASGEEKELALDYPERIKEGRRRKGLTQEELAKQINERKSVIIKVESGEMRPDDKLVRKLERALAMSLKEVYESDAGTEKKAYTQGMTLGDFIKYED